MQVVREAVSGMVEAMRERAGTAIKLLAVELPAAEQARDVPIQPLRSIAMTCSGMLPMSERPRRSAASAWAAGALVGSHRRRLGCLAAGR